MHASKFFTLLSTLRDEEVAAFQKHLKQVHAKKDIALRLFDYIRKARTKAAAEKKLNLEYAYRKIYHSDIGNNRKAILNTLSDLHLWLKDFLLFEKTKSPSFESRILWLSILQERGLQTEFSKQAIQLRDELEILPKKSLIDYQNYMVAQHFVYYHLPHQSVSDGVSILQKNKNTLDLYKLAIQLRMDCDIQHLKQVQHANSITDIIQYPPQPATRSISPEHPLLRVYQDICELIHTQAPEQFKKIEALLSKQAEHLDPKELDEILLHLFNYASAKVRANEAKEDWKRIHQLNKLAVAHQVFIKKGEMPIGQFLNIVGAACKAKDFDWARSFITSNVIDIPADIRPDTALVANAIIFCEKKAYKSVVKNLEDAPLKDLQLQLRSKLLLVVSYYELGADVILILDTCAKFEVYLRRNRKHLLDAVQAALNFIHIVKLLVRRNLEKGKILAQLEQMESLYYRIWLEEKLLNYNAEFAAHKRSK